MRTCLTLLAIAVLTPPTLAADAPPALTPIQKDMTAHLDAIRPELVAVNQDIWTFAEVGLEEHRSAARLVGVLKKAGFKVKEGVSGMPTAFVAEYGSGKPVIGILAEYDALPELSQDAVGIRKPALGRTTGHGCGHSALGTAAVGAALAVKEVYDKHKLKGTLRVYGTPAEETLIGKVYMSLDGQFADLDACLHWHPGSRNRVWYSSSKALISAKFTFHGLTAHASGSPDRGLHTREVRRRAPGGLHPGDLAAGPFGHDRDAFCTGDFARCFDLVHLAVEVGHSGKQAFAFIIGAGYLVAAAHDGDVQGFCFGGHDLRALLRTGWSGLLLWDSL